MTNTINYTKAEREAMREKALEKMTAYCRTTPRSHLEIRSRLYAMGLWKWEREEVLSRLISDGRVSEERFAGHFVSGKIGNWGKMRIKKHLVQQHVSEYNIKHVLKKVDDEEYRNKLYEIAREKWDSIKGADIHPFLRIKKTSNYLLHKGYEYKLVTEVLEWLKEGEA